MACLGAYFLPIKSPFEERVNFCMLFINLFDWTCNEDYRSYFLVLSQRFQKTKNGWHAETVSY